VSLGPTLFYETDLGVRDVRLGLDQSFASNHDNALIVSTCRIRRKLGFKRIGHIPADYGEIPIRQFEDIGAGGPGGTTSMAWSHAKAADDLTHC
jgi:hypothetical protein